MNMWIQINRPTPVLNTPDFRRMFGGPSGKTLHPEFIESVALPGMSFPVVGERGDILEVLWESYSPVRLYIDRRFGTLIDAEPHSHTSPMPSAYALLKHMESRLGAAYVWGGNWADGIPELLDYYPPHGSLEKHERELWMLRGVDCSGLLFEASGGLTPRNSYQLMHFGKKLEPQEPLKPLDMIVYPGHVLFVRDPKHIIESKSPIGVRICSLEERLKELRKEKQPFQIRRFAK